MDVSSRLIKSVTYDAQTQTLDVELHRKGHRRYFNVPPATVKNLVTAQSPGWYYTQHIHTVFPRDMIAGNDGQRRKRFSFSWLRLR